MQQAKPKNLDFVVLLMSEMLSEGEVTRMFTHCDGLIW